MNINSNFSNYTQNYTSQAGQDVSLPPEILAQLAAQNQTQAQAADYGLQGPGQDAMLSISDSGSAGGSSGSSGVDPQALSQQMEQQISGGDLAGALSTLQQLQAGRPEGGEKPPGADQIDSLEATLTQQLQNNDQEGAEATLAQIQSSMGQPSSGGTSSQSQNQSVDQLAGLGQPQPFSNGQFPGSKGFQRTAPTAEQKQQILPPYQALN